MENHRNRKLANTRQKVFDLRRNHRSDCVGICSDILGTSVRFRSESLFAFSRNECSFSVGTCTGFHVIEPAKEAEQHPMTSDVDKTILDSL